MSYTDGYIRAAVRAALEVKQDQVARDLLNVLIGCFNAAEPLPNVCNAPNDTEPTRWDTRAQALAEITPIPPGTEVAVTWRDLPEVLCPINDPQTGETPAPFPATEPALTPSRRRRLIHNKAFWAIYIEDNYIPHLVACGLNSFKSKDLLSWIELETKVLTAYDIEADCTGCSSWRARVSHSLGDLVLDGILERNYRGGQTYTVKRYKTAALAPSTPHHPG